ncbi:hypothetical protein MKX83_24155 [Cytobacillus sp. FSL M8-0252]|uniref:hypothetical protein n=1 Tax=Cytobacillus sp. FSL M8-0252 TaxID=2921621 RepID=UPI0030FCD1B8
MKIKSIETEIIKCTVQGKQYDCDRYNIDIKTPLSTKEYSVSVDFHNKEIWGDTVQYGSLYTLENEEIKEILTLVEKEGKTLRPFKELLQKIAG